jgi:chemotaxis signal transduction protein
VTAVFVPEGPSRFVRADPPSAPDSTGTPAPGTPATARPARPAGEQARARRRPAFAAAPVDPAAADPADPTGPAEIEGYVLFAVGGTTFAVAVGEVREIVRAARLELLPQSHVGYGHGVALVDIRGRSIPVVDLRSDRDAHGDVLLPMWRHQVGLVVDHVVSVLSPRELGREHDEVPAALPSYSRGVLRPVDGGAPVLLIAMPDAAELEADAGRVEEPRLGDDVLAVLGIDAVEVVDATEDPADPTS